MSMRLTDLKINEISGVDKPANRRNFLIIKSIDDKLGNRRCSVDEGSDDAQSIIKSAEKSGKTLAEYLLENPGVYKKIMHCIRGGGIEGLNPAWLPACAGRC